MLELKNIYAGYTEKNYILKGIDLKITEGDVIGIIGQNGSGKSTLAKTIMNMVPHINGQVLFCGKTLSGKSTNEIADLNIGYFLQGGCIFPHLTIKENLEFALRKISKQEIKQRLEEYRDYFDLLKNKRENLQASCLSGGEQHQLALAMILLNMPRLLISDEASAGLSPINTMAIYKAINEFREKHQTTVLLIEQNISVAFENSNKIMLLENGVFSLEGNSTNEFEEKVTELFFNI